MRSVALALVLGVFCAVLVTAALVKPAVNSNAVNFSSRVDQCVLDNKNQLNVKDWCVAKIRLNK